MNDHIGALFASPAGDLSSVTWPFEDTWLVNDPANAADVNASWEVVPRTVEGLSNWLRVLMKTPSAITDDSRPYNVIHTQDENGDGFQYIIQIRSRGLLLDFNVTEGGMCTYSTEQFSDLLGGAGAKI